MTYRLRWRIFARLRRLRLPILRRPLPVFFVPIAYPTPSVSHLFLCEFPATRPAKGRDFSQGIQSLQRSRQGSLKQRMSPYFFGLSPMNSERVSVPSLFLSIFLKRAVAASTSLP